MLQSVSEQIFNTISWHCIHHYGILLLTAYVILVHEIRKQVMGIQGVALTKTRGLSLKRLCATADKAIYRGNRLDTQLLGMRSAKAAVTSLWEINK